MLSMSMSSSLSSANFPSIVAWNDWLLGLFQTNSKGHHHQVMIISYVYSRKAHCPMDILKLLIGIIKTVKIGHIHILNG